MKTRAYFSGKVVVTLFIAIVYYSYLIAPDWIWMYFVKPEEVPHWMVFYILILYLFAYDVGFFLKFELGKINRIYPILMLIVALAWAVGVTLALKDRYLTVGTLEQFQVGQGIPLSESTVGKLPGALSACLFPLSLILIFWSRRQKFN